MKILYLKEEELAPVDTNSSDTVTNVIQQDNPIDTNQIKDNPPVDNYSIEQPLDRKLPPPNRNSYDYHIVPYYIPVGIRNNYRNNYLDYDRVEIRDLIGKNFDFTDGSPGILARYDGIVIKAGSKSEDRKNRIIVDIDGEKFYKRVRNSERARKIVAKLINILYNEGENKLLKAIIKYNFY